MRRSSSAPSCSRRRSRSSGRSPRGAPARGRAGGGRRRVRHRLLEHPLPARARVSLDGCLLPMRLRGARPGGGRVGRGSARARSGPPPRPGLRGAGRRRPRRRPDPLEPLHRRDRGRPGHGARQRPGGPGRAGRVGALGGAARAADRARVRRGRGRDRAHLGCRRRVGVRRAPRRGSRLRRPDRDRLHRLPVAAAAGGRRAPRRRAPPRRDRGVRGRVCRGRARAGRPRSDPGLARDRVAGAARAVVPGARMAP
jgi:hypothetical protein